MSFDLATIVWFRTDLRLADNSPLRAAAERGGPVLPVFVWAPDEEEPWAPGAASRWWLHQSLAALDEALRRLGSRLILRQGNSLSVLQSLLVKTGATAVFWNRRYEPVVIARDHEIERTLSSEGVSVETYNDALLHDPTGLFNQSGKAFKVFTPFWRRCLAQLTPAEPLPAPRHLPPPKPWPHSLPLSALSLEPRSNWTEGIGRVWHPGEAGAQKQLKRFSGQPLLNYGTDRDRADLHGTSRLSPHLHFGEVSPRQVWHSLRRFAARNGLSQTTWQGWQFVTELGWREFAHHLLFHFPESPSQPLRSEFQSFPWREGGAFLGVWQRGVTGYPLVDAGMRELWSTGWMHNRLRMLVGSFLVKDLLVSWLEGARWFWDTLVDADLAQNTLGWQWIAGCGTDAAPYFRIFNPVNQGEKLDPSGGYVRRWCPELARLPNRWLHAPWQAPPGILSDAGVRLGETYPEPVAQHGVAREVALEAFARMKSGR